MSSLEDASGVVSLIQVTHAKSEWICLPKMGKVPLVCTTTG